MKHLKLFESFNNHKNVYKVYHGTNNKFGKFNFTTATQGIVWFTDSIDSIKNGEHGGMGNKYIMTRYITINNPAGWPEYEKYCLGQIIGMGYDGIILPQGDVTDYIVFSNKNISAKPPIESSHNIDRICEQYKIKNYTINKDGSIDVDGHVNLSHKRLTKLPIKFRNVSGYFNCKYNELTTLGGCPTTVGNYFSCINNKLNSLEGGPSKVGYFYSCSHNNITSFIGCASSMDDDFNCYNNPIYDIWKLFEDYNKIELFNDYDIIRDDNIIILDRLNDFLEEIGKPTVTEVQNYKCI